MWSGEDVDAACPLMEATQALYRHLVAVPLRTGLSPANRPRPDEMLEFNALPPKGRLPEAEAGRDGERVKWERAKRKQAALRLAT